MHTRFTRVAAAALPLWLAACSQDLPPFAVEELRRLAVEAERMIDSASAVTHTRAACDGGADGSRCTLRLMAREDVESITPTSLPGQAVVLGHVTNLGSVKESDIGIEPGEKAFVLVYRDQGGKVKTQYYSLSSGAQPVRFIKAAEYVACGHQDGPGQRPRAAWRRCEGGAPDTGAAALRHLHTPIWFPCGLDCCIVKDDG